MLMRPTHVEKYGVRQVESDPGIYVKIVTGPAGDSGELASSNREVERVGSGGSNFHNETLFELILL